MKLLAGYRIDDETGSISLTIDKEIAKLYSSGWTGIDWEQRQTLHGKPLALWLHSYYTSHAAPFPVKVETLHRLCGSSDKILRNFKRSLQRALDDLKVCRSIADWKIDPESDLVNVDRGTAITDSQRRHLAAPKRKRRPVEP